MIVEYKRKASRQELIERIEELEKEIEELKEMKPLQDLIDTNIIIADYSHNYISKDKIREKIKEITNYAFTSIEERECQVYARQVLKNLLEEK